MENTNENEEEENLLLPAPRWEDGYEWQMQSFNVGHREIYEMYVYCKPCGFSHLWLNCPKPKMH